MNNESQKEQVAGERKLIARVITLLAQCIQLKNDYGDSYHDAIKAHLKEVATIHDKLTIPQSPSLPPKEQGEVPPGITAFYTGKTFLNIYHDNPYEYQVRYAFKEGFKVQTIQVGDKQFSVGDEVYDIKGKHLIESFSYSGNKRWVIHMVDYPSNYADNLSKIPTPAPSPREPAGMLSKEEEMEDLVKYVGRHFTVGFINGEITFWHANGKHYGPDQVVRHWKESQKPLTNKE